MKEDRLCCLSRLSRQFYSLKGARLWSSTLPCSEVLHVVPVALEVTLQLRQRDVVRVEGEQAEVLERAGEHLRQPLVVIFGDGDDRDQVCAKLSAND